MAKFTKYNNPNKRRKRKYYSRSDADIIATKSYFDDRLTGNQKDFSYYDALSDHLSGKPSREIYKKEG